MRATATVARVVGRPGARQWSVHAGVLNSRNKEMVGTGILSARRPHRHNRAGHRSIPLSAHVHLGSARVVRLCGPQQLACHRCHLALPEQQEPDEVAQRGSGGPPEVDVRHQSGLVTDPAGSLFYTPVRWAQCQGLAGGYSDASLGKYRQISRGKSLAMIHRYLKPTPVTTQPEFTDVTPGQTLYGPISWAAAQQISGGYADNTFRSHRPVTRGEFASSLYCAVGPECTAPQEAEFTDVPMGRFHYAAITWMSAQNLAHG